MDFAKFRDSGELSDIAVAVDGEEFKLHKFPLYIKSDFFRAISRSKVGKQDQVDLDGFPGGSEVFEKVANFCYNMKIDISKENVCAVRCAAEFLQMTGPENLCGAADRFLQDTLTAAKLGRNLDTIVDLLLQCCALGGIAEQAGIVERCINGIVDCWLISHKFAKRYVVSSHSQQAESEEDLDNLTKLPLSWFVQLFKASRDKSVRPGVLANLVQVYVDSVLKDGPGKCKLSEEPGEDEDASNDDDEEEEEDEEDKDVKQTGEDTETDEAKVMHNAAGREEDSRTSVGEVLDTLLMELPESAFLTDSFSAEWAAKMLAIADEEKCRSRPILLKLCARLLPKFTSKNLSNMKPELLSEMLKEASAETGAQQPEVVCSVVDNFLLELAKREELGVDEFQHLVNSVPPDCRTNHDKLFQVLEKLLKSEKSNISDEERQKLLEQVDFTRLSEDTLQRAHDTEMVPVIYVTKAALALCTKLRADLEAAKRVIRSQEEELERYGLGGRGGSYLRSLDQEVPTDSAPLSTSYLRQHYYPETTSNQDVGGKYGGFSSQSLYGTSGLTSDLDLSSESLDDVADTLPQYRSYRSILDDPTFRSSSRSYSDYYTRKYTSSYTSK